MLGIRTIALGFEVLIQWEGLPPFKATWESIEVIQHQFPAFHLEYKVTLTPTGNVRPPICFTYSRRRQRSENEGRSGNKREIS